MDVFFLESVAAAAAAAQHALKGVEINFLLHSTVLRRWGFFYSTVFEIVLLHRFIYQVPTKKRERSWKSLLCQNKGLFSKIFIEEEKEGQSILASRTFKKWEKSSLKPNLLGNYRI